MLLRNWTLRARLTALVVALLAVASIVIGAITFIFVKESISAQFDSTVQTALHRAEQMGESGPGSFTDATTSIEQGTIVVAPVSITGQTSGYYVSDSGSSTKNPTTRTLSAAQVKAIVGLGAGGRNTSTSVRVPGYGDYRFFSPVRGVAFGLPLSTLERQIAGVLLAIALIVVGVILIAGFIAALTIGRALRPLRRVSGVATNVAQMELERGEVPVVDRVPARDVNSHTEVGQVGLALNNLLDSVESALGARQASEAKVRAFVADASHELRTPLASIRGYAELTRRFGGELTEDVQHNIARIESESKRMTALVEDLLLLARLDSQRELDSEEVDLSRLLVDVVSDAHAAGRDHTWDLELPDEPVVVTGDDARLHQVFTNLLANARVHTPAGTKVTVELRQPAGEDATVLVRDSGPGIPAELQPSLFERFVRGDSSRNRSTGSTGLGLSIVSAVVQAHHGSVTVTSQPGETTFRVVLPVHQPATPSPAPTPATRTAVPV